MRVVRVVACLLAMLPALAALTGDVFSIGLVAFPIVGLVVLWNQPHNTIGWLLTLIGALPSIASLHAHVVPDTGALAIAMSPLGSLGMVGIALIGFLVALFPSGHLPSPRWRWPARAAAVGLAMATFLNVVRVDSGDDANPAAIPALQPVVKALVLPSGYVVALFGLAALVNVFWRLRGATGDEREQLRWFAFSACIFPAFMFVFVLANGQGIFAYALFGAFIFGFSAVAVAVGVAVLKYRLYAIDVVINKTLVYGALTAFITLVYVAIVVGLGSFTTAGSDVPLSLAATGIVAYAFQPVRGRLQAIANRMVYGQRLSPYEAVASFARRVTETFSSDRVLAEMAEAAALGVGAARSRVRLVLPSGVEHVVHWPSGSEPNGSTFDRVVPVVHDGESVGDIAVAKGRGEPFSKHDEVLLGDLATEASLAMASLRLTEELQQRLADLQESRRRIVSAQDDERRRMERDLHDGAQQQLVAIKIKLGLVDGLIDDAPDDARALVAEIAQDSSEAIGTLRDLARGLFPTVLVERGLAAAVGAHAAKSGVDATVSVAEDGLPRLGMGIEANVYFVVREALQNASKYAPGAPVVIALSIDDTVLNFSITDEGLGFDAEDVVLGNGTQNMRDRIEALGGTLEVSSAPGSGTSVRGTVPTRQDEPVIDLETRVSEAAHAV